MESTKNSLNGISREMLEQNGEIIKEWISHSCRLSWESSKVPGLREV